MVRRFKWTQIAFPLDGLYVGGQIRRAKLTGNYQLANFLRKKGSLVTTVVPGVVRTGFSSLKVTLRDFIAPFFIGQIQKIAF